MRYFALIVIMATLVRPAGAPATVTSNSGAVLATEQRWVKALAARDVATVAEILDSGFIHVNYQGKVFDRGETLARAKTGAPYTQNLSEETVTFAGANVAIVDGVNSVEQNGSVVLRLRFTDTFHYADGKWKAVWAQETAIAK